MVDNIFFMLYRSVKNILGYQPPSVPPPFVLDEHRPYDSPKVANQQPDKEKALEAFSSLLRYAHRLEGFIDKLATVLRSKTWDKEAAEIKLEITALDKQLSQLTPVLLRYDQSITAPKVQRLSTSIEENRRTVETIYQLPRNNDIMLRDFSIAGNPRVKAFAVFIEGMVDSKLLDNSVLQPLMLFNYSRELYEGNFTEQIVRECLPSNQIKRSDTFASIETAVNSGSTAIIFDGIDEAIIVGTGAWEHRGVERSQIEQSVQGSQAAFSENFRINTGLVRSMLRTSDLIIETIKVGTRSQINCALMYIDSIANTTLVDEVRRRIQGIATDYLGDTGELIQFIEDHPSIPFPQSLSTERPDRVAGHLVEGRIAILLEGNPFVHIVPVSFFSFFHSAEDFSHKPTVVNFMRILRLLGAFVSIILPSIYIAISYFHQDALPTELLLAIAGSRENVTFPAWFEIVLMEFSFELIREAGIRVPGFLGSSIGIVGALILGQAAVYANIVSPIIVIIVASTGLASFCIPDYRMASAIRLLRFILLAFAATFGLVGLATAFLWIAVLFCQMKSFGVPYMTPVVPKTIAGYDVVLRGPIFQQDTRPDALNVKDQRRQPNISRTWKKINQGKSDKP
ncbi:MAG: GerA spore germination protein [Firmicutes bacterium]|nr:GerA spore germination protein [Bacillota bacterium]